MFIKTGKHLIRIDDVLSIIYQIKTIMNISEGNFSGKLDDEFQVCIRNNDPKDGFIVNLRSKPYELILTLEEGEQLIERLDNIKF